MKAFVAAAFILGTISPALSATKISPVCSRQAAPAGIPLGTPPARKLVKVDADTPVAREALKLAYAIETGRPDPYVGVTGNFDGTGLSLGIIQFNFLGSIQSTFGSIEKAAFIRTMPVWGEQFYRAVHSPSPSTAVERVLPMQDGRYSERTGKTVWVIKPDALKELRSFLASDESRAAQDKAASRVYQRGYSRALQWAQERGDSKPTAREIASFVDNEVFSGGALGGIWIKQAKSFRSNFDNDGEMIAFVSAWLKSCPYKGEGFLYGEADSANAVAAWAAKYPPGANIQDDRALLFAFGFLRALTANGPPTLKGQKDQRGIFKAQVVARRSLPALGTGTANGVSWPGGILD